MRVLKLLSGLFLAVSLLGPAVVQAQSTATELRLRSIEARLPDADKLAELERKVERLSDGGAAQVEGSNGGATAAGGSFNMLQDIQGLQEEVRALRGEIDELKFKLKQSEQGQRELFQNLDERISALESGGGGSTSSAVGASADSGSDGQPATANPAGAEQAYESAFNLLKKGEYKQSITAFNEFVSKYPNSQYTPNAWYWLGEAHYVDREYEPATRAFRTVLEKFPDSAKAPGALYKIGVVQDEQGDTSAAQATLGKVVAQFPDDNAAELARKRLRAIEGNGGRNP